MRWSTGGRSLATAATANHVAAQVWNPATTRSVWCTGLAFAQTGAVVSNMSLARSTARGATPTLTKTPTINSDWERKIIPPSGAVLELATFTTQPTLATPEMFAWNDPATIGSGVREVFEAPGTWGMEIPAGTGLCIYTPVAVILQPADFTFYMVE